MAAVLDDSDQKIQVKTSESTSLEADDDVADIGPAEKVGTRTDHRDMLRMGKNQQLKV
jgi:hypothetical protein